MHFCAAWRRAIKIAGEGTQGFPAQRPNMEIPMSVLTRNGEVYADMPGALVARLLAVVMFVRDVAAETRALQREMIRKHGLPLE
jgi:hypothetical protein